MMYDVEQYDPNIYACDVSGQRERLGLRSELIAALGLPYVIKHPVYYNKYISNAPVRNYTRDAMVSGYPIFEGPYWDLLRSRIWGDRMLLLYSPIRQSCEESMFIDCSGNDTNATGTPKPYHLEDDQGRIIDPRTWAEDIIAYIKAHPEGVVCHNHPYRSFPMKNEKDAEPHVIKGPTYAKNGFKQRKEVYFDEDYPEYGKFKAARGNKPNPWELIHNGRRSNNWKNSKHHPKKQWGKNIIGAGTNYDTIRKWECRCQNDPWCLVEQDLAI